MRIGRLSNSAGRNFGQGRPIARKKSDSQIGARSNVPSPGKDFIREQVFDACEDSGMKSVDGRPRLQ